MFGMKVTVFQSWHFERESLAEAGPRGGKKVEFTSTAPKGTAKAAAVDRH